MYNSVVTPLIKRILIFFNNDAFFYLYPYIFAINIKKFGLIDFSCKPLSLDILPWLISFTFVTGFLGFGSALVLILSTLTSISFNIKLFNIIVFIAGGLGAWMEISLTYLFYTYNGFCQGLNQLFLVVLRCKLVNPSFVAKN